MKKLLFLFSTLVILNCSAQKKEALFLTAELNKTKGLSLVYSKLLKNSGLGLGAGIEFIDISSKRLGGIMPGIDIRYYSKFGRSTIIPLAQLGYNFYQHKYQIVGTNETYEMKGGPSFSLGIGYSYSINAKGSGPFTALKFRSLPYKLNEPLLPKTKTADQLKISVGWRF